MSVKRRTFDGNEYSAQTFILSSPVIYVIPCYVVQGLVFENGTTSNYRHRNSEIN